jgi:hypothetical protein
VLAVLPVTAIPGFIRSPSPCCSTGIPGQKGLVTEGLRRVPSRLGQLAPHVGSRNRALAALAPGGQRSFPKGRKTSCPPGRPVCGPLLSGAAA